MLISKLAELSGGYEELRLLLGDQLNANHSWFREATPGVLYLLAELPQEQIYVRHHVQKTCAILAAMEQFALHLDNQDHQVLYLTLDESAAYLTLDSLLDDIICLAGVSRLTYQQPDEYRLHAQLAGYQHAQLARVDWVDSEHFYLPMASLGDYFTCGKQPIMETFYRRMRVEQGILLEDGKPLGGKWNYDQENRKKLPDKVPLPPLVQFSRDVSDILARLEAHDVKTIGSAKPMLDYALTRADSFTLLEHFLENCLECFGTYQDALSDRDWLLFHSRLSFSINVKLVSPREVVDRVLSFWTENVERISLAQVEGFVRQILGWREYMRGIYWSEMPAYRDGNFFGAGRELPAFFWTAETEMACMRSAINASLDHAYAHHIQRLMVTGNFCLLAGINPDEVDAWYLGIYADAFEWVQLPNTRGMSQYADGGIVATKPYISSGQYIQRMGGPCKTCRYNVKEKTGDDACPFNVLYWNFLLQHEDRLRGNRRMALMYKHVERMSSAQKTEVTAQAQQLLRDANSL